MPLKISAILLALSPLALAQNACSYGTAVTSTLAIVGPSCTQVATPAGNEVYQPNLTGAMTSQTICDTTTTPGSSTYCPGGFLRIDGNLEVVSAGTLVSAASLFMTYTTDVRTYTGQQIGTALSLVTPVNYAYTTNFYHQAGTAVTMYSTVAALTGSPSYTVRARTLLIGNQ